MQCTDDTLSEIDSEYWNFNVCVAACTLSLVMILSIKLFQLRNSSIYTLQEENIMIYYLEFKTTSKLFLF